MNSTQEGRTMRDVIQDIKYAIRSAAKQPGFTAVVLLTLGIGIGANTAIFSVLHAVVLKPLPYPAPEQLVMLWEKEKDGSRSNVGYPTFYDWRSQSRSFDAMAAMSSWTPTLSGSSGEPESLEGASVTADFFRVLGVRPFLGRDFTADDDRPNQPRIAIISYGLWQRRFGSDPNLIGKPILLAGVERTVVGIMPPDFQSLLSSQKTPIEIWRPLAYQGEQPPACRGCRHLRAVGRIKNGVSRDQAQAELDTIFASIRRDHSTDYSSVGVIPQPLQEEFSGDSRTMLLILFGAVACVLMVACANVAGLLLSRSAARRKDIAVCVAMGAARGRIVRQLLTESMVLAAFGGTLGVFIAYVGTRMLASLSPIRLPRLEQAAADPIALAFAAGVTVLTGILFGLAPAVSASDGNLHEAMKEGSRGSERHGSRLRETLVVADVALALVLLTAAGLMMRSVMRLLNVETGFSPANVLTMQVSVFGPQYAGDGRNERINGTWLRVLDRVRQLPGVQSAGMVSQLPLGENGDMYSMLFKDKPIANPAEAPSADRYCVTPGYLEAMGIRVIRGRALTDADNAQSAPVVLISDALAEKTWPGEDPIGKSVHMGEPERPWWTVVGVVRRVRHERLDEQNRFQFYTPTNQWFFADSALTLAVRNTQEAELMTQSVRDAVRSIDRNILIDRVATMETVVEHSLKDRRFVTILLSLFSSAAVLLAAIGLYGLMAFTVTQRTPEIAIRIALGAAPAEMLQGVLKRGVRMALVGVSLGVVASVALSRLMQKLLFEVSPGDPITLIAVATLLCLVAAAACWIPARRAARVDPMIALRQE